MSLLFLMIKVFPAFGLSLGFIFFDIARSFKRKGNKAWIGFILVSGFFVASSGAWVYFRGDRNADLWFGRVSAWVEHK
jgi:hypothetical protein